MNRGAYVGMLVLCALASCTSTQEKPPTESGDSAFDSAPVETGHSEESGESGSAESADSAQPDSDSGPPDDTDTGTGAPNAWAQINLYGNTACAITNHGDGACWGYDRCGEAGIPAVKFGEVSLGLEFGCGLDPEGTASFWGLTCPDSDLGETHPPAGRFHALRAGWRAPCALDEANEIHCWGYLPGAMALVPVGAFLVAETGGYFACGLDEAGYIECWGKTADIPSAILDAPSTSGFTALSVGTDYACALQSDGAAVCWGDTGYTVLAVPERVLFSSISAGYYAVCGITLDGGLECWGGGDDDYISDPVILENPGGSGWAEVSVGSGTACALTTEAEIVCWGQKGYGLEKIPELPEE